MARPKYKHMSPYECYLFDHFLGEHGNEYDTFEYDIHVGEGMIPPEHLTQPLRDLSVLLTQKRIDAVGFRGAQTFIFEVKPHASLSALGQLIAYKDLYQRQFLPDPPPRLAVITDFHGRDEIFYFGNHDITIYAYPGASGRWRLFNG